MIAYTEEARAVDLGQGWGEMIRLPMGKEHARVPYNSRGMEQNPHSLPIFALGLPLEAHVLI